MKTASKSILLLVLTAATALAQIPEDEGVHELQSLPRSPLIYLDDTTLTVGHFGDYLFNSGVHPSGLRDRDLDTLRSALESFIDEVIITRDADSAAILSLPQSRRRMRWRMAHRAGPLTYVRLIAPRVSVSESEIEQLYRDSIATLFTAPPSREVRHLLIAPRDVLPSDGKQIRGKEQFRRAFELADSLKTAVLRGTSFDSLAGAFSDDSASRSQNGYLGWIYPGNTTFDFDTAAFAAEPGVIRGPVRTMFGYHLILVEQTRPETKIALNDSLSLLIRRQIEFAKGRALGTVWADSVLAAADWRFNLPQLERVPDVDSGVWMVAINGRDTLWWDEWSGTWELNRRSRKLEGQGSIEDRMASLKQSAFPYLYLQIAEDLGFADDSTIVAERWQYLKSEALRLEGQRLRSLQEPPADKVDPTRGLAMETEPEKPLHVQMIRAADTATIWAAYRSLLRGDDIRSVARRYHDNMREARNGAYDLGWIGPGDIATPLWGAAWILESGRFTRPIEHDSAFYIFRLEDRYRKPQPEEKRIREIDAIRAGYRQRGLDQWRHEIRAGHRIRFDKSYWNRVQQLWRP